jgi:endonuclease YncB( thermonuclease family)
VICGTWIGRALLLMLLSSLVAGQVLAADEPPAVLLNAERVPICDSGKRITCVVDGDTVWFEGVKYRFEEVDTPEKGDLAECVQEGLQAIQATKRLAQILSMHPFTIQPTGTDRYGRTLARFVIGSTTAGEMLVSEGLARSWNGHTADWCD